MRGVFAVGLCLWAMGIAKADPVAVVTVAAKPQLDGILVEWGAPERIAIVAGGDRVGVRGAFTSEKDHEADVYLMWDADYIYVAVAVVDDIVDVGRIAPGKNEWRGPSGERKDIMFYYDHLKIFLRGPERPLGHNIWFSPAEGVPYLWGGMQRGKTSERVPVEAGGVLRDGVYTFEVAIPWTWLNFYPQPDMVLDALFLLPDSDLPGQAIRKKVRKSNKWIWWQGKVQLVGRPPGLKEPIKERVLEQIAQQTREIHRLGRDLHGRLGTLGSHVDAVGRSLNAAVGHYNSAVASLESRVLVSARRFADLAVTDEELGSPRTVELRAVDRRGAHDDPDERPSVAL